MIHFLRTGLVSLIIGCFLPPLQAQDEAWQEQMKLLIYAPRYFGPNAFPLPELRDGSVSDRYEIELRGEYHFNPGDRTKDLFGRLFIPFAGGRAGVEISGVIEEDYETSDAVRDERHAIEKRPPIRCYGDAVISSFYRILRSDRWFDATVSSSLKTASGGRLCDARYTDAAAYWFDLTAGRDLVRSTDRSAFIRLQAMVGFYCWMTNNMVHRQNDATLFGAGLSAGYRNLLFACDYSGFDGYRNEGDYPVAFRYKLNYEYKKNILSLRYRHGMKDNIYDFYSVGYIRCF
jgi:hypothetical protein